MEGLLAWAANVVRKGGGQDNEQDIPLIFTQDQQRYVLDWDHKAYFLGRSIHDLQLKLPPSDISQCLPDLHAHSLASNAAPVLQLNFHIHEDPGSGSQTPYDFQATREKIRLNAELPSLYVISVV
ncbi:hypothetical protein PS2_032822 [Malus domestica]